MESGGGWWLPACLACLRTGFLLGIRNKDTEGEKRRKAVISCHDWDQEEGGGSLKSWTR